MAISESEHDLLRNVTNNNSNLNLNQLDHLETKVVVDNILSSNAPLVNEMRINAISSSNKIYTNEQKQIESLNDDQSCLVIHANKGRF